MIYFVTVGTWKRCMTDTYVELHAASAFSFLEASSHPEALVECAYSLNMPAMALLDRNGIYGAARFHAIATQNGIHAHIGAEIVTSNTPLKLAPPLWLPHQHRSESPRLALLCASQVGYHNLCQLITRLKMRETVKGEGSACSTDLEEFADGLICMTGGDEGLLAAALIEGGETQGKQVVKDLANIFGRNNVYVELQRHGDREEEWRNQAALRIARSLNLPILATNGVRYATQADREILDLFTCIRNHTDLDHAGRLLAVNSQRHLRSSKRMASIFRDLPNAIDNTGLLSQRLQFRLNDLGYIFPKYSVPEEDTMDSFLRKRVLEGITSRYGHKRSQALLAKALKQAERELVLIAQLGFAGYFLIVWDIVRYCFTNEILVQGRGSAANSVVCYALQITAIDPIEMDLLFERFLSESRDEWPDIDLDLPSGDAREKAIRYVYNRYGELGAAMTANVITYRGKLAAGEVAKVFGFNEQVQSRLSSLVGRWEWHKEGESLNDNFSHAGFDMQHPRIAKYAQLCKRIQNFTTSSWTAFGWDGDLPRSAQPRCSY